MAAIGNSFPSLIDHFKSVDKNGNYLPTIEALTVLNPIMRDAYVEEANNGFSHLNVTRTGLPQPTWGKLYQGIPQSKSTKQQVEDTSGFVESLATVDTRLLNYKKNPAQARADEANAHREAMAQDVQTNFFYADTATTPERFKGIAARYNSLAPSADGKSYVIDAGGTGVDNTSIWLIGGGRGKTGLFYPEGSRAGIIREDKGEQRTTDDLGNPYYVKEEYFRQDVGVTTGDYRYNVRIANLDVSDLRAGNVDIYALLRKAMYRVHSTYDGAMADAYLASGGANGARSVIYLNRDVMEALDAQTTNDNKVELRPADLEGKMIETYRRLPIRMTDAIINAEARVQ